VNARMIIPRVNREETTFAVIEFAGLKRHELQAAVQRAVTEWTRNSEEGRRAYANSGEDFNVGDLANELSGAGPLRDKTDPLHNALIKQGLTHLSVDVFCDDQPTGWEFDDHLVLED